MRQSLLAALRGLALSLMLFGAAGQVFAGIAHTPPLQDTAHHAGDGHDHSGDLPALDAPAQNQAALGGGIIGAVLDFLGGLFGDVDRDLYCSDCGHSGSACQCDCWSGNPKEGECG